MMPRPKIPDEDLLDDLRRVAREVDFLSESVYRQHGEYAAATVKDRFGGWNAAKDAAGLATTTQGSHDAPDTLTQTYAPRLSAALREACPADLSPEKFASDIIRAYLDHYGKAHLTPREQDAIQRLDGFGVDREEIAAAFRTSVATVERICETD